MRALQLSRSRATGKTYEWTLRPLQTGNALHKQVLMSARRNAGSARSVDTLHQVISKETLKAAWGLRPGPVVKVRTRTRKY